MERFWLEHYPKSVPADINPDEYRSLVDVIDQSCERFSERDAYTNLGYTMSFAELEQKSRNFGAYLQQELGLNKGDRIALMMPNLLQYPVAMLGALRAGLTVVNVNPLYTARELKHQLNDSGATTILILANFAHVLAEIIDETPVKNTIITNVADMLPFPRATLINMAVKHLKKMVPKYHINQTIALTDVIKKGDSLSLETPELQGDDLAFLQYTGGTTGVSKGAMLTHRNLIANLLQMGAFLSDQIQEGEEVAIAALPLYHIFCLTCNCLMFLRHGGHNILITNPRDIPGLAKELKKIDGQFTFISGVNTLYNALTNNKAFSELDFSGLKLSVSGGMAVQQTVAERWFEMTGTHILEGYGLTESSPVVSINPVNLNRFSGSVGYPIPSTDISLRDEDGQEVPRDQSGEIWVRGPQVMKGYWQRPEETAKTLTDDGWLKTGDVAIIDPADCLRIVDRKKDMILVSGFNVFPNEIEEVISQHPGVLEVACIGVDDKRSGEAVKVFVVAKPGVDLDKKTIIDHCRKNLTNYKIPKQVEFRDELPKSNIGKILRRALR